MLKRCERCGAAFVARWRNTPAVCAECVAHVIVCPACWRVTVPSDPAQLTMFPAWDMTRPGVAVSLSSLLAAHFANTAPRGVDWETYARGIFAERAPWPRETSRAERMRQPYH